MLSDEKFYEIEQTVYKKLSERCPRTGDTEDDLWNIVASISAQAAVTAIREYLIASGNACLSE